MNRTERIKYYDDLLEENTERVMKGLLPTPEYKRLDDLTDKCMAQIEAEYTENFVAMEAEVMDFLDAFERLFGARLLEVH